MGFCLFRGAVRYGREWYKLKGGQHPPYNPPTEVHDLLFFP
jgi:hypothetical protein